MSKRWIKAAATDQTIDLFILDSSSTTGAGLTGLTSGTSGLTCYYRKGATGTAQQLTLASQTVGGAHTDGGFVAIDGTNMPGLYRLDLSDTMVAAEGMLTIMMRGATNMAPVVAELEIVDIDIYDSVRLGLTALPNAAAEASGGMATLSAAQSSGGTIPANMVAISGDSTAADNLEAATDGTGYNVGGGQIVANSVSGNVGGNVAGSVNSVTTAVTVGTINTGVITAASIATDAITSEELATSAVNEIANAVWSANITNDYAISPASSAAWANDTMGKRVLRSSSNTDATEAVVADAVWEEPRGDHDTGNTMGHSLDQIRKANFITEGTVNSTTGATTTSFRTNLTGVDNTYQHQTILFVNSAALNGQSAPILSYAQTNGVITLGDGLTVAPSLNDEFVILPTHVYPMSYIVTNILEGNTSTSTYAAGDVGNILARLHNMIEADGADFRYTTNALEQAPGGGGGGSTTVRMGPFVIKAEGQGADEPLDINKGATHAIECQLVDAEGTGVDITGATLTAKVYNSAGTLVETVSGTISYAALGQVRWTIGTTTTNTAGTYTVTITRTTGASDTQIFGPLRVYVRDI